LVVARKWSEGEDRSGASTGWVQLRLNPDTAIDALAIAAATERSDDSDSVDKLRIGPGLGTEFGQVFRRPTPEGAAPWLSGAFYSDDLERAATALLELRAVPLPRVRDPVTLPLRRLRELGSVGPDIRDIRDGFERSEAPSSYPALWNHDSDERLSVSAEADVYLTPLARARRGRPLRDHLVLWESSGRLMVRLDSGWSRTGSLLSSCPSEPWAACGGPYALVTAMGKTTIASSRSGLTPRLGWYQPRWVQRRPGVPGFQGSGVL
jgi:hypothetical protein